MESIRKYGRLSLTLFGISFISSCAGHPSIQPQVNSLVIAEKFDRAIKILETQKEAYGKNNDLLYFYDKGLVFHYAKRYKESISVFEEAKLRYDELFTKSLSKIAGSWITNDYTSPYRGEDFERVMINIFQAINYAALENFEEALVEARDVDSILSVINAQYRPDQKNVYREDAFARFLMGILYEASGRSADLNDAFISYERALSVYETDYKNHYGLKVPLLLKENLLTISHWMGAKEFEKYKSKFTDIPFLSLKTKNKKGEVYLILYQGLSPIKHEDSIVLPLPNGYIAKFAFPRYDERSFDDEPNSFWAIREENETQTTLTEVGEDIGAMALKNLNDRKLRVIAKAIARPLGKYMLERLQGKEIEEEYGEKASDIYRYSTHLYNIFSEQADLRSWQTLSAQIQIGRLILEPGGYSLNLDRRNLGTVDLKPGDKKFFILRTTD